MYRRGQASAVGAVFLTLIVILLAALIARQIQVQTEVQKIASEVATQRSGEGQLSLTLNYTYLSFSLGNVRNDTYSCIPSLTSATCIFPSSTYNGKHMLTLYFSAINVPNYYYNVTSNLYLSSNETVEATLYENNNGTLIARGTYTLPANSPIVITSHFVNYTIIFSSTSPFRISIDFLNYTFQAYNSTGFYAKITNIGPSLTRLYGLWLLNSTYATRINTSTWLEPGASQTFSVKITVSSISEIRAVTTTRINILRINIRPPTHTGTPGSGGGGGTYLPVFRIASYNSSISGPVGSKQRLVVTVQNTGNASGNAVLTVIDNNGNTVNSTTLSIPAGQTATATLTVTLPSSRGTYTWKINVTNQATGKIDDTKTLLVVAKDIYLQSRGAVSLSSFDTLPSWTQDPAGSWSVSGGVLTGTDISAANKAGSIIYNASYTTSGSIYLLVATQLSTTGHVHWGFILARDTSNWIFAGIYTDTNSYYLEAYQVQNDRISGTASRGGSFTASGWATLFAVYTPTSGGSSFTIQLYTAGGNFSYTASLGSSGFHPGLTVNDDDKQRRSRLFDNFIASTSDPRIVTVTGLQQGWIVELYDQTGNLIARATADTSGKATLGVLASPITTNGKIVIKDASGNAIIQKTFTQIVGGDTYSYG
jgi:hypothetical protein